MRPVTVARVDLDAIEANVRALTDRAAPARLMLVAKDDGFGHGLVPVSRAGLRAGATSLGVLDVPTALEVRAAGVDAPLLAWLHGTGTDFDAAVDAGVELGVSARWQLDAISRCRSRRRAVVHLEVETGMGRAGVVEAEWPGLVDEAVRLQRAGRLRIRAVWSHLADTSWDADTAALARLTAAARSARARGAEVELLHLAASAAAIDRSDLRLDLVRVGIAAYGVSPFPDRSAADLGLVGAMRLTTAVVPGSPEAQSIRIAAGWAQGLHPSAAGTAEVQIGGVRHRLIEIGVDASLADPRSIDGGSGAAGAHEAVVFGPGRGGEPTVAEWASWAGTAVDEILLRIPAAVPRVHRGGSA